MLGRVVHQLTKVNSQAQPAKRLKTEPIRISSSDAIPSQKTAQSTTRVVSETQGATRKIAVKDGSKYPEVRTSSMDLDAIPTWEPAGKPITEVDLDADIAEETKPWRVPGTDPTGKRGRPISQDAIRC